jgi:hypothetical protein
MKQLTAEIYAYLEKYSVNDYSIEISYKFGTGNIKLIWEIDYIRCEIFIFDNQIGLVEELLNQKFEMIKSILIYNLKK